MRKQYRNGLMASIHETAEGLHTAGVMSKPTMREFDEMCPTAVRPLKPREIRTIRLRQGASQAVFCPVSQRDHRPRQPVGAGEKWPQGASLKLLSLIAKKGLLAVA